MTTPQTTTQKELSACCQASLVTIFGDEGTNHYSCSKCYFACDIYQEPTVKENLKNEPDWKNFRIPSQHVISVTEAEDTGGFDVVVDISGIIKKKEAEYKEERNKVVETAIRQIDLMAEDELRDIEKLKQQHQVELLNQKINLISLFHSTVKELYGKELADLVMKAVNESYAQLINSKKGE